MRISIEEKQTLVARYRALGMIFYGVQGAEAAAELLRQGRDGEAA